MGYGIHSIMKEQRELTISALAFQKGQDVYKDKKTDKVKQVSQEIKDFIASQGWYNLVFALVGIAASTGGAFTGGSQDYAWVGTVASTVGQNSTYVGQGLGTFDRSKETYETQLYNRESEALQGMSKAKNQWDQFLEQINQLVSRLLQIMAESNRGASGR